MVSKRCGVCLIDKPTSNFYNLTRSKDGLDYKCKSCQADSNLAQKEYKKFWKIYQRYKLSKDRFFEILASQSHTCGICGTIPQDYNGFCVDHNHETGEVRGILCQNCNAGLGMFKENEDSLTSAIQYLRKYNGK